jgi:hypothetical protein
MTTSSVTQTLGLRQRSGFPSEFWSLHREASLNWLALGLLLAAWNATDDGQSAQPRPQHLRGYSSVSVRGAMRAAIDP